MNGFMMHDSSTIAIQEPMFFSRKTLGFAYRLYNLLIHPGNLSSCLPEGKARAKETDKNDDIFAGNI